MKGSLPSPIWIERSKSPSRGATRFTSSRAVRVLRAVFFSRALYTRPKRSVSIASRRVMTHKSTRMLVETAQGKSRGASVNGRRHYTTTKLTHEYTRPRSTFCSMSSSPVRARRRAAHARYNPTRPSRPSGTRNSRGNRSYLPEAGT
jgi:hypothetical protein